MAVTDVSILKKKRQQKKAMRFIKKLVIFIVIAASAVAAILTKDIWYPKLNGILSKVPSAIGGDSDAYDEQFPIEISSNANYHIDEIGNNLAVLNDSHFLIYNSNAKEIYSQQHTMTNPIMETSNEKALLYDLGGNIFALSSKYKNIYTKTTDFAILFAEISNDDYAAVVTKNDKLLSYLMVFDENGTNVINYGSVERIIDVTFTDDSSGCYITTVGSSGGIIVSDILYYEFEHIEYDENNNPVPIWKIEDIETLPVSVRLFGTENIIVFGDTMCAYYDINGTFIKSYDYFYNLSGYDSKDNIAALIFNNNERRSTDIVIINSLTGEIFETTLDYTAKNIQVSDGLIYVHSRDKITAYTSLGEISSEITLDNDYDEFLKINNHVFLLGYDQINKIDIN